MIDTPRLVLRRFVIEDLDDLAELLGDARVMEFSLAGQVSRDEASRFVDRARSLYEDRGWGPWAVEHRRERRVIGFCGPLPQSIDGVDEVEIGYRLLPAYWGQGLATEAANAARDDAFDRASTDRLISIIEPANVRSIRVAEKNGMHLERETTKWDRRVRIYVIRRPSLLSNAGLVD